MRLKPVTNGNAIKTYYSILDTNYILIGPSLKWYGVSNAEQQESLMTSSQQHLSYGLFM